MKIKLFLHELYVKDKRLFLVIIFFLLLQAFFTYKGVETIPFFHWGMYSAKADFSNNYSHIDIIVNHQPVNVLQQSEVPAGYFFSMVNYYSMLRQHQFQDPIDKVILHRFSGIPLLEQLARERLMNKKETEKEFQIWLCRYLSFAGVKQIENIEIVERHFVWKNNIMFPVSETVIDSFTCIN